ncbi:MULTISPECIES: prolipoprotein diacylglyceryl transferase [unclassified Ruminococcus]|uniref:prolipoprotein diacylglyceryl transferase n=1 Tax=unclassified Ruminococcus TaxID=2608920 RepID=UPI00210E504D|nr:MULTISPECIES: prolipoprotein diacylglyceryl transferase [unclassified Ruminococcus]MCQ4022619.1 hypothetical protein [Ruminococcus sp. zg-924]MCQ4114859.1 hypothetical protein [Ruminococcus sp. zg-921]
MSSYINIFGLPISSYGLMVAFGIVACVIYAFIQIKKQDIVNDVSLIFAALWIALGIFIGSHILYGITNIGKIIEIFNRFDEFFNDFGIGFSILITQIGGMVFYGGLIGGAIAAVIYLKTTKKDVGAYCDFIVPCIPLFHFFGRIGCFLGGCCYGIEFPIGFTYTNSIVVEANGVCRLPIPLIEAFFNILIFILLLVCYNKHKIRKGNLVLVYCFTYPVVRFVDEFFRGDAIRGFWGPFSTSQWISIAIFTVALVYVIVGKIKGKKFINSKKSA